MAKNRRKQVSKLLAYALSAPIAITATAGPAPSSRAVERQLTNAPKNHFLDNNDNFSPDGRFLCYDTREMVGPDIGNCRSIEKVEVATGKETLLYQPAKFATGEPAAPGVGAASFAPRENKVVFIHGPPLEETAVRGSYGKSNRQGATVAADGNGALAWLDRRDVATSRDTTPGAQRGGTHRHEYSLDGKRIGCTYDDYLLTNYDRTIAYMEKNPKGPADALYYFGILVTVVPRGTAQPGQLERAAGDSWVGRPGLMRGFIGRVRELDGSYQESLFVVDVPANVDITTADSGSATRFPSPPKGVAVRRLTHKRAEGIVRGTVTDDRIAYYGGAADGTRQVFVIPSDGSDESTNPAKRPVQVTHLAKGAGPGLRWHPSGDCVLCTSNGGIVAVYVRPGSDFGKMVFLTAQGDGAPRDQLVLSPDGTLLAYNRIVETRDNTGQIVKNYCGRDLCQIFLLPFSENCFQEPEKSH